MSNPHYLYICFLLLFLTSCQEKKSDSLETPFGTVSLADTAEVESADEVFTLDDVQTAGLKLGLRLSEQAREQAGYKHEPITYEIFE